MDKKVIEIIDSEIEYAKKWDTLPRGERPIKDSEKPVEFWLLHMELYLRKAQEGCSGTDKIKALENIRKLAGLCVRCMEFNETPKRE